MPDPTDLPRTGTARRAKLSVAAYAAFLVTLLIGWRLAAGAAEGDYGESLTNLSILPLTLLLCVGSAAWAAFLAPLPKPGRLLFAALFLAPIVGWFALVKGVRWSGDMVAHPIWRWERTSAERRADAPAADPVVPPETLPVATELDYAGYRGPARDGVLTPGDFDLTRPPEVVWSREVGGGFAGMAAVDDFLVTIEQIGEAEAVVAYDAADGRERWRHVVPGTFTNSTGSGPRSTPAIDGADVFALTSLGQLACIDLLTGGKRWTYDGRGQTPNTTWGTSASPLIDGGRVLVNFGTPNGGGLTALDRETGEEVWRYEPPAPPADAPQLGDPKRNAAGYGSPMVATLGGVRQVVLFDGDGVGGYDPETGDRLWFEPFANEFLINVAQPLVFDGDRVFICSSYGLGGRMLRVSNVDGWSVEDVWASRRVMKCKFTSPVAHAGHIYGLSEGNLQCVDAETGKVAWMDRGSRYRHGQILLAGDVILVQAEDGRLAAVRATPERFEELWSLPLLNEQKSWNPPSLSRGRLFARDHERMVRLDFGPAAGGDAAYDSPGDTSS